MHDFFEKVQYELNEKPLNTPFITNPKIMAGGNLKLELCEKPNHNWGVEWQQ